ncbi:hypothetical protein BGZ73_001588 [Actinomortierella ambigua]|nr:hypothetical protein BGZ73_001588 [Actinomortierella ambigua]
MASNHTSNSHHDIEAIGKEEENTDHFDSAEHREQCHNIQRQVFQQLGKLTKLRLLLLGDQRLQIPAHERSRFQAFGHFDCLDFSLALDSGDERNKGAGGLRYLAHLNELEILDVAGLLHNIGIEEVTWMLSYWPKLKKIHGLAHGYNGGNIQAMQFLRNNYPSVALR